jgi:hypothetical protein
LETAKRVGKLPVTEAALRKGALSGPQANALSDAGAANPGAEQKLLDSATRSSLGELRDHCARAKAAADPDPDATHRRIHDARRLRRFRDAEGAWNLVARGTTDAGAQWERR